MAATANVAEIVARLKRVIEGFAFTETIEGKTLGLDCAGIVADGIQARSVDRESGASGPWPPNSSNPTLRMPQGYRQWKLDTYGVDKPNVRTGQMLSLESLIGGTTVSTHDVQMQYGTGQPPTRSATGMGFDPKRDGLTDVEKAYICSMTRPFYELDDAISDRVFARVKECCSEYLVRAW